jgi:rhamnose transport system substrate-binding protein
VAAAARYLSTSQAKGKVLTGLSTPNQMRAHVKDSTVDEFALWNPKDLGYLAAFTAKALIDGKITGKKGDTSRQAS